jgi:hypothetical protein
MIEGYSKNGEGTIMYTFKKYLEGFHQAEALLYGSLERQPG